MSYAGICGSDNLQSDSDFMYSATSIEQIVQEYNSGWGGLCPVETDIGNEAPVAIATGLYEIPANTPFELSGGGSDNDNGDVLTYSWEQQDSRFRTSLSRLNQVICRFAKCLATSLSLTSAKPGSTAKH